MLINPIHKKYIGIILQIKKKQSGKILQKNIVPKQKPITKPNRNSIEEEIQQVRDLPDIVGLKIIPEENSPSENPSNDTRDPDKFMRKIMGHDYSILLNNESEKQKPTEDINLNSFLDFKPKETTPRKQEEDKNLFTVIEENVYNGHSEILHDDSDDIDHSEDSFASDDSDIITENIKKKSENFTEIIVETDTNKYENDDKDVLVKDYEFKSDKIIDDNEKENYKSNADEYKKQMANFEKHKIEVSRKIPMEIINKFCEMIKNNKDLVNYLCNKLVR